MGKDNSVNLAVALDPTGIVTFGGKPANFLIFAHRPDGVLDLASTSHYQHIIDCAAEFGFTLDQDVVDFSAGKKDNFLAELDKEFATWGKSEVNKRGKTE